MRSTCGSPFCRATYSQATLPAAPGRFSAMTCWPHSSVSFCASVRARMSEVPPGGKGMTMRTVLLGKACAQAGPVTTAKASSSARTMVHSSSIALYRLPPPSTAAYRIANRGWQNGTMSKASIRNVVEEPWQQFPGHFGGALSKALVRPENVGSRLVDYRISTYQPMAYVETHAHKVQEQIYHVLEGEGAMEIDGKVSIV